MNISKIQQNKAHEVANRVLVLRDGNIIEGKITKIHPNNQAEIQIDNRKIMAKVLTPLTIGERYFFQVQQNDQLIHLKVIGNALRDEQVENISNLLQRFGLRTSKQNVQFVQSFIHDKIPFNQSQMTEAIRLLNGLGKTNMNQASQIIRLMMANHFPLTEPVFQSLQTVQQNSISGMIQEVQTQLQQMGPLTSLQTNILHSIQHLLHHTPQNILEQTISTLSNQEQHHLYELMQRMGILSENTTFNEWNRQWQQMTTQVQFLSTNQGSIQTMDDVWQTLSQLIQNRNDIQTVIQKTMNTFYSSGPSQQFSDTQFTAIKHMIQQLLWPLLPEQAQQQLQAILSSNDQPTARLHSFLSFLSNHSTLDVLQSLSMAMTKSNAVNTSHHQEQFLSYMRQFVPALGLADEFQLTSHLKEHLQQTGQPMQLSIDAATQSIKSLLIQIIQQGQQQGFSDKAQQLLHFINGMQLQSLQESPHLLQALLQIPGDKFGVHGDMTMQFEGKKTTDGKLNPDFCRILFVLDLANIRETVIDMQVQKRIISMTIFNDDISKQSVRPLEVKLKKDLESLNFQLSSIQVKRLVDRDETRKVKSNEQQERSEGEGIEFFV